MSRLLREVNRTRTRESKNSGFALRGQVYIWQTPSGRIACVTGTKASNIIELRQRLAEQFPGVRMEAGPRVSLSKCWPTGLDQLDPILGGGLVKSGVTEVISAGTASGAALLLSVIIEQAHRNGERAALVDGADAFDAASLDAEMLSRFLWVRCSNTREAVKAADILLHDGTIPVIAIDLISCVPAQLRKTPSSTWFRLARLAEASSGACVIFTPEPMIGSAESRIILQPRFTLDSLETSRETLLARIAPRLYSETAAERRITRIA